MALAVYFEVSDKNDCEYEVPSKYLSRYIGLCFSMIYMKILLPEFIAVLTFILSTTAVMK